MIEVLNFGQFFDLIKPAHFLLISALLVVAALVQGSTGFGFGIIAAPALLFFSDWLVPGPLVFTALILTVLSSFRERQSINFKGLFWLLAGRLPGTLIGLGALVIFRREKLGLVIALIILLAVALSLVRGRFEIRPKSLLGAGLTSGFMGTISAIGGPPVALVLQHRAAPEFRATIAVYFTVGATVSLAGLHTIGLFSAREFVAGLLLTPAVLFGFALSGPVLPKLNQQYSRSLILLIAAAAGFAILIKYL